MARFIARSPAHPVPKSITLDERLANRDWVIGSEYTIADISLVGWVRNLIDFYEARELVSFDRFHHVQTWLNPGLSRPAV